MAEARRAWEQLRALFRPQAQEREAEAPLLRGEAPRPLVLVDVDGTLSPAKAYPQRESELLSHPWHGAHYLSQELREELQALPADKLWLTSWEADTEALFTMGWGSLVGERVGDLWKLEVAARELARRPRERLLWLDDDCELWREAAESLAPRVLCLAPSFLEGLTPAHLEEARAFLEAP